MNTANNENMPGGANCSFDRQTPVTSKALSEQKDIRHEAHITTNPINSNSSIGYGTTMNTTPDTASEMSNPMSTETTTLATPSNRASDDTRRDGLKSRMKTMGHQVTEKASGLLHTMSDSAASAKGTISEKTSRMTSKVRNADYARMANNVTAPVKLHPARFILIAAGIGLGLGLMSSLMRNRDEEF